MKMGLILTGAGDKVAFLELWSHIRTCWDSLDISLCSVLALLISLHSCLSISNNSYVFQ